MSAWRPAILIEVLRGVYGCCRSFFVDFLIHMNYNYTYHYTFVYTVNIIYHNAVNTLPHCVYPAVYASCASLMLHSCAYLSIISNFKCKPTSSIAYERDISNIDKSENITRHEGCLYIKICFSSL
jgi:hypothetical protein